MFFNYLYNIRLWLIKLEKLFAGTSLVILLIVSLIQVTLRNLFDFGFADLDVITRHLVLFITFMGAALASEGNQHIKIDCVTSIINDSLKQKLKQPLLIISSIVWAVFFWHAIKFWLDEYEYSPDNEQLALYLSLILPAGFFTLSFHFFLLSATLNSQTTIIEQDE